MEKISGLVLDAHDDVNGAVMRSMYPTIGEVPDLLKTASAISPEQRDALPDDVFALILRQGDVTLRKYACVDAGNTALNIGYFLATYNVLPMEAVKTAAANLCVACHWYDIEPPEELKKLSTGNIPVIGKQQVWKDLDGTTYSNNTQSWDLEKSAEVSGTFDMNGASGVKQEQVNPNRAKKSVVKTAGDGMGHLVPGSDAKGDEDTILEQAFGITEKAPEKTPQVKLVMKPSVDVTSHEPPTVITEKQASRYALPSLKMYPLDGIDHIEKAAAYFNEWHGSMEPRDRREFAYNLVKRASEVRRPLSQVALDYGGEGYAKEAQLIAAVDQRALLLMPHADQGTDDLRKEASVHCLGLYKELFDTRATLTPEVYAASMAEIDKLAGLDEFYGVELEDPWLATFSKVAEDADPQDAVVIGNEYMTVRALEDFASSKPTVIESRFGDDFRKEFQADPKAIFDSLPVDQKKVIMRMVNNSHSVTQGASAS